MIRPSIILVRSAPRIHPSAASSNPLSSFQFLSRSTVMELRNPPYRLPLTLPHVNDESTPIHYPPGRKAHGEQGSQSKRSIAPVRLLTAHPPTPVHVPEYEHAPKTGWQLQFRSAVNPRILCTR